MRPFASVLEEMINSGVRGPVHLLNAVGNRANSCPLAGPGRAGSLAGMSVHEIMEGLATLGPGEQAQVSAYLFHLRHAADEEYQARVEARLADRDPAHWLTPEEFERRLDTR